MKALIGLKVVGRNGERGKIIDAKDNGEIGGWTVKDRLHLLVDLDEGKQVVWIAGDVKEIVVMNLLSPSPRHEPKFSELLAEYQRLIDKHQTVKDIADAIGRTSASVSKVLQIGKYLSELEIEMIDAGRLTQTHAYELTKHRMRDISAA